jgi:hypothetical protein
LPALVTVFLLASMSCTLSMGGRPTIESAMPLRDSPDPSGLTLRRCLSAVASAPTRTRRRERARMEQDAGVDLFGAVEVLRQRRVPEQDGLFVQRTAGQREGEGAAECIRRTCGGGIGGYREGAEEGR